MNIFKNENECSGCTLCKIVCPTNAITMVEDEKGFLYPKINQDLCINCNQCKNKCHNIIESKKSDFQQEYYACKNRSLDVIKSSTSGGVFSAISDYVLENKGIVYGVKYDESFNAIFQRCTTKEERDECKGSKYVQSHMFDSFVKIKSDLENNLLVLFTGTPCQVSALLSYLNGKKYDNLITLDFVCHGTPSPGLFKNYINFIEGIRKKKIKKYQHRNLENMGHREKIIYSDNSYDNNSRLSSAWKILFYKNLSVRPSCYKCKYASKERYSDLTMGDFHGLEQIDPKFYNSAGVSLLIVSTSKGSALVKKLKNIELKVQSYENMVIKNPQLNHPININDEMNTFWSTYISNGIKSALTQHGGYNLKGKIKNLIKNIVGKS